MTQKQKVLIVGGGFGGVKAALELAHDPHFAVTLLSNESELRYYPTLYHTATGGKYANSSIPLFDLFQETPVRVVQGEAVTLDRRAKLVMTSEGQGYEYDQLILALGVVTNYFGIPGMAEYSYSIKSQSEVARFKRHIQQQLVDERKPDLNYVIVGAGPTGIELAGALPGYIRHLMEKHNLPHRKIHVDLVEAAPCLLPRLPKATGRTVSRRLRRLGVTIYTGGAVQAATANDVRINGKPVTSHTIIWTAGVTNHPFFAANQFVLMGRGKVAVDTYLQTEPGIFVIGDNANTPFSGLAQTALHDGTFVARNLKRQVRDKKMRSYMAKEPITVIPAGPYWAAVVWNGLSFSGRKGWLLREAADLLGFHDLMPWPQATKQFFTEFSHEDL